MRAVRRVTEACLEVVDPSLRRLGGIGFDRRLHFLEHGGELAGMPAVPLLVAKLNARLSGGLCGIEKCGNMAHAAVGDVASACCERMMYKRPRLIEHFRRWAAGFHASVQGRIGTVPGEVLHLWHGELANRRYSLRHLEFSKFAFDPHTDLVALPGRPFELRPGDGKDALEAWFRSFFEQRHEDGVGVPRRASGSTQETRQCPQ